MIGYNYFSLALVVSVFADDFGLGVYMGGVSMNKRYQVFVSSTYTDLKEERQHVTQTLMGMDCIPAGMELFPAMDEEQWEFIKRVIDDCDYYVLIVGARYGTLSVEGISYTEQEYEYAVSKGIKVIALIHAEPEQIVTAKSEQCQELRAKLEGFRVKVSTGRLVRTWKSATDLPGLVALSLTQTIRLFPALGWVRANESSNEKLLSEINDLRKANKALEAKLQEYEVQGDIVYTVPGLASIDSMFELSGQYYEYNRYEVWRVSVSWRDVFYYISPYLINGYSQDAVKSVLVESACARAGFASYLGRLDDQVFQTVSIQMQALGLVRVAQGKRADGKFADFWSLTTSGKKLMVELRAIMS